MIRIIFQRILAALVTLSLLCVLTFLLLRLAPGGPFDTDRVWPPEIQANIQAKYGLNLRVSQQMGIWFKDLLHGDLHESFQYLGKPVSELISEAWPVSILLGTLALLVAVILGIPLGCLSAWKQGTWIDRVFMFVCFSGLSLPTYLLASLLILIFSLWLMWFPPALWEGPEFWVLPTLTLAARPLAILARLTRTTVIEVLRSDFIRTAYGKGLSPRTILFKHALKNSLIPVVSVLGPLAAQMVTGSFLVEIVFQIPGLGMHFVQSVLNRDYPLVMGLTLTYGVVLLTAHLLVDLSYSWIDPRIRVES